ncbi:MAG: hypothetical protein IKK13_01995 [Clostridia bacterium]|jgi:TrpR-related protein YerC/YecD|nr:hypothetical protein [Clostridia bacterium]
MAKKISKEDFSALYKLLADLETEEECESLLGDLCTIREVEQMAERVRAAKMLIEGNTYNEIIAATNISSATLSRISRSLQYGNGYSKFLK